MADKKQLEASKIDALYSWISYDLQKMKGELLNELKYSSVQTGALYKELKADREQSSSAIAQEIRYSYKQNQTIYDGLSSLLTDEVAKNISAMDEKVSSLEEIQALVKEALDKLQTVDAAVALLENINQEELAEAIKVKVSELLPALEESLNEVKYSYMQQQAIYDGLHTLITCDVIGKLDNVDNKLALLEQIDSTLTEIADVKSFIDEKVEKAEESANERTRQVLEAIASIPVAENVDYNRIVDEVGDKVLDMLNEVVNVDATEQKAEPTPVEAKVDYDKIIYGTAEKVVESLPYPEKVDYRRINDSFAKAAQSVQACVSEDMIAGIVNAAVEKAIASIDLDALASAVAQKIEVPAVEVPEIKPAEIDYDKLADMVAERLGKVENVDYDKISSIVEEKVAAVSNLEQESTYNLVVDDEGLQAIADGVSQKLCDMCEGCQKVVEVEQLVDAPVEEEIVEEVQEEATEEVVEEVVEEVAEEPVQEEQPASEELAITVDDNLQEMNDQLVDAETGLVIRLKKSFTAKMKQSDEKVKGYYSDIKNELTSYKKINSNVSWHGDRFNLGRETIAKMNICGKTLCFYLALDPENPEFKPTVYHQRNVGEQKAYQSTPFMVKIKSDAAAKKALRLVGYLAEKLQAEKKADFEAVDYVEEFAYQSTKQLFEDGYIKITKEKKVELDF